MEVVVVPTPEDAATLVADAYSALLRRTPAAVLGLATGSETDVVVYMIAQRFGRDIFATVLAVIMSVFALLAATGPLLAGSIFDQYDSYEPYLMIGIPLALLATLCIALVPDRPVAVK